MISRRISNISLDGEESSDESLDYSDGREKPVIAVDVDEVLCIMCSHFCKFLKEQYGQTFREKDFMTYDWFKIVGGGERDFSEKMCKYYGEEHYLNAKIMPNCIQVLQELSQFYEFKVVTARLPSLQKNTIRWLKKYFPNIFSEIYFTRSGRKSVSKAEICRRIDAKYIIDDSLSNAMSCSRVCKVFLFGKYAWNQSSSVPPKVKRVNSWQQIYKLLMPKDVIQQRNYESNLADVSSPPFSSLIAPPTNNLQNFKPIANTLPQNHEQINNDCEDNKKQILSIKKQEKKIIEKNNNAQLNQATIANTRTTKTENIESKLCLNEKQI